MPGTAWRHVRSRKVPRYHLNIYNDQVVLDQEGCELADLAHAKELAIEGARAMMAEHLTLGRPINLCHYIDVADSDGKVLATLPFRELITIVGR